MAHPRMDRGRVLMLLASAVTAVAVGLAACGTTSPSSAAGTTARAAVKPAPSRTATGHVLVQGTVQGAAANAETSVRVVVWPHDDDSTVGEVVDTWESPAVRTDPQGRWAIEVDPAELSSKYLSADQPFINFDIAVDSANTGTTWSTSAWTTGEGGFWRSEGATVADRNIDVVMDLSSAKVTVTDSTGESTTSPLALGTYPPTGG